MCGAPLQAVDLLALQLMPGVGHATIARAVALARTAGTSLSTLLGRPASELLEMCPPGAQQLAGPLAACGPAHRERAGHLLEAMSARGIRALALDDPAYPAVLKGALGLYSPSLLFLIGDAALLGRRAGGVVGTRAPSRRGARLAADCARTFVDMGVPVVSGGARGIDLAAHEAALRHGGATIIVLPQGLLSYRIPPHFQAAADNGCASIVSEFAPQAGWRTHAAVTRNATISAFAHILCVIEPRKAGGSIQTARNALDRGKAVFYAHAQVPLPVTLMRPSAAPLLTGAGKLDPERILAAWRRPCTSPPHQAELL